MIKRIFHNMASALPGLITLMLSAMVATAAAQETLTVSPIEIAAGEEAEVTVGYESTADRSSMQMNITLPEGLAFVTDGESGKCVTPGDAASDHLLTEVIENDTQVRLIMFSMTSAPFADGKVLLSFRVKADNTLAAQSQIEFSNLKFAGSPFVEGLTGQVTRVMGHFEAVAVSPDTADVHRSLGEVVLTMSAPVGAVLDDARATVARDGETVGSATLAMSDEAADVKLTLDSELTDNGTYTITIPEGVIFDNNYDAADPLMSGTRCNAAMTLEFKVLVPSGIDGIAAGTKQRHDTIYTIGGVRTNSSKGIRIINGKKVVDRK